MIKRKWTTVHIGVWMLCAPVLLFATWNVWLTAVLLLLLLGLRLTTKRMNGRLFSSTFIDPFITFYLFLASIAMWLSPAPQQSIVHFVILAAGVFGYYAAADWLVTPARRQLLLLALTIGGSAIALLGFFIVEWPSRSVIDLQIIINTVPHLGGGFYVHPNEMAGMMALLLPVALFLRRKNAASFEKFSPVYAEMEKGIETKKFNLFRLTQLLLTASAVIMAIMLLLTQSRNAWVALLLSIVAYTVWGRFRTRYMLILLFLWILLPLGFVVSQDEQQQNLVKQIILLDETTKEHGITEQSWASRLEIWSSAKQTIQDYPIIGAGWSMFDSVSRLNYIYTITRPTIPITHAHNLFLQTAVNTGLAGLLTGILLWLTTMAHLWRHDGEQEQITAVLGASFTAYLWFNTFDVLAWDQKPGLVVWLLLAVGMTAVPIKKPLPKMIQLAPLLLWLFLMFTPSLPRNFAYLRLDKARLTNSTGDVHVNVSSLENDSRRIGIAYWLMGEQTEALAHWQSDDDAVQFLIGQGQQAFVEEEWQTAVSWHTAALTIDPMNGAAYYERGRAYEAAQMPSFALADYEQATILIPSTNRMQQAIAWAATGQVFIYFEEWDNAMFAFTQANLLAPDLPYYQQQLQKINQQLQKME